MNINVNGVNITLTKEQLQEIERQLKETKTVEDINSYEDACEVLELEVNLNATATEKILTIVKAVNFIDNDCKIWKPNFLDTNEYKWFPYFKMTFSGWVFYDDYYFNFGNASVGSGFYFKKQSSVSLIANKFIALYNEWLN
jgi:hypothetical protein